MTQDRDRLESYAAFARRATPSAPASAWARAAAAGVLAAAGPLLLVAAGGDGAWLGALGLAAAAGVALALRVATERYRRKESAELGRRRAETAARSLEVSPDRVAADPIAYKALAGALGDGSRTRLAAGGAFAAGLVAAAVAHPLIFIAVLASLAASEALEGRRRLADLAWAAPPAMAAGLMGAGLLGPFGAVAAVWAAIETAYARRLWASASRRRREAEGLYALWADRAAQRAARDAEDAAQASRFGADVASAARRVFTAAPGAAFHVIARSAGRRRAFTAHLAELARAEAGAQGEPPIIVVDGPAAAPTGTWRAALRDGARSSASDEDLLPVVAALGLDELVFEAGLRAPTPPIAAARETGPPRAAAEGQGDDPNDGRPFLLAVVATRRALAEKPSQALSGAVTPWGAAFWDDGASILDNLLFDVDPARVAAARGRADPTAFARRKLRGSAAEAALIQLGADLVLGAASMVAANADRPELLDGFDLFAPEALPTLRRAAGLAADAARLPAAEAAPLIDVALRFAPARHRFAVLPLDARAALIEARSLFADLRPTVSVFDLGLEATGVAADDPGGEAFLSAGFGNDRVIAGRSALENILGGALRPDRMRLWPAVLASVRAAADRAGAADAIRRRGLSAPARRDDGRCPLRRADLERLAVARAALAQPRLLVTGDLSANALADAKRLRAGLRSICAATAVHHIDEAVLADPAATPDAAIVLDADTGRVTSAETLRAERHVARRRQALETAAAQAAQLGGPAPVLTGGAPAAAAPTPNGGAWPTQTKPTL